MVYPYLIELRLGGDAKDVTRKLIFDLYNKFGVRGAVRRRPVPHVTLFGPFNTKSVREIKEIMKRIGNNYSCLDYEISGFGFFERKKISFIIPRKKKHAIYLKIKPDSNLFKFRQELAKAIMFKSKSKNIEIDSESNFSFHVTLAMKDIHHRFDDIWNYLKLHSIETKGTSYRITLLNKSRIVCEYDFAQKRILNRNQALSRNSWKLTEKLLDNQTQFWVCPNCGNNTQMKDGRQYCSSCKIYLSI